MSETVNWTIINETVDEILDTQNELNIITKKTFQNSINGKLFFKDLVTTDRYIISNGGERTLLDTKSYNSQTRDVLKE